MVYTIVAPFMTDSEGNISEQLTISITEQKGANLSVRLTADSGFIHTAKFPVIIDPELTVNATGNKLLFNEAYASGYLINHGPYYLSSGNIVTAKVNSLQSLAAGEKVVSAKYNLSVSNYSTLFTNDNESCQQQ